MIQFSHISNQTSGAEAFAVAPQSESVSPLKLLVPDQTTCREHIDQLVLQIESPHVREIVGTVFLDLLRLLECLGLVENHLRQVDAAEETFAFFRLIHDDARELVHFIRTDALDSNQLTEELADTLDGITFAINHDLQRVFESDPRVPISQQTAHAVVGKLFRAHDVLTNCLQQSTITLAMLFDPELVGARLFDNSDLRYRQSLQLCQDLSSLLQLLDNFEKTGVEPAISLLAAGVEKFRNESMEFLMYSDWPQFESFCETIDLSKTIPELEYVLHQFRCYLETLLGQVRMRAVLANAFPIQFGDHGNATLPITGGDNSTPVSVSADLENEEPAWGAFAFAV